MVVYVAVSMVTFGGSPASVLQHSTGVLDTNIQTAPLSLPLYKKTPFPYTNPFLTLSNLSYANTHQHP